MKRTALFFFVLCFGINSFSQTNIVATPGSFSRTTPQMGLTANAIYHNTFTNATLLDSLANIHTSLFRFPGGTPGNYWNWQTGWVASPFDACYPNGPSPTLSVTLNKLKTGLDSCHAELLYTLNMWNSNLAFQMQGIDYAAQLGIPMNYFEFGNEHNLPCDSMQASAYAALSKTWADTVKAHYPNSKICLVGGDIPNANPNWVSSIAAANINYDALSFHVYPLPPNAPFNVKSSFAKSYFNTGLRFSSSHFASVPSKEVWVTEFNMSIDTTGPSNTWTQSLFLLGMMDTMIQQQQITKLLPFAYSSKEDYLQMLDYNSFKMQATGVAAKLMNDASSGMDSCRKISFTAPYQSLNGNKFPAVFGYEFYNTQSGTINVLITNLSGNAFSCDYSGLNQNTSSNYQTWTADTAQRITNGFQNLFLSSGTASGILQLPAYSVTTFQLAADNVSIHSMDSNFSATVFPNPTNHNIYIKTSNMIGNAFSVYDIVGRHLLTGAVNSNMQMLDVTDLPAGRYILKFENGIVCSFVKQ